MLWKSARERYRKSAKGKATSRTHAAAYYHRVLKHDPVHVQKRLKASRRYYYERMFGISPEKADALKDKGCNLCGSREGKMNIDHKHDGTPGWRGVLCNPCNQMVGWIELAKSRMAEVEKYISRGNHAV